MTHRKALKLAGRELQRSRGFLLRLDSHPHSVKVGTRYPLLSKSSPVDSSTKLRRRSAGQSASWVVLVPRQFLPFHRAPLVVWRLSWHSRRALTRRMKVLPNRNRVQPEQSSALRARCAQWRSLDAASKNAPIELRIFPT